MSREKRHILIALAIAFVARLAMYPFAGVEQPEFFEYGTIASMLASGQGYTMVHAVADQFLTVPSAWMPPGQTLI
ncbi:MAG TPA: hypothetical protein VFH43_08555, partial [Candidatus Kapabacteria bacterium]|nr:hypothetical protein [Candidatus Kapabacteria bacterium]